MSSWEKFSRIVAEAKASKKLDPVGHEDADVDNDGDSDSSDSYLRRRRASVGAAIAADKKRKVEEAKQLDPVGQEDDDIDNDGDSDKSDKYLLNRRKVRSKIIQREEVEQIDEIAPLVAAGLAAGAAIAGGAAIKRAQDAAKSGVNAANRGQNIKNPGTGIAGAAYGMQRRNNALNDAMKQLRQSYEIDGSLVEAKKKDDSYLETDMKKRRENNEKAIEDMKKTKGYSDMVKSARKAMGVDEEFVGEDKEYRREMAKAAARERAEEKRSEENYRTKGRIGKKKEGPKLSTTPHRESESKNYADKEMGSIKLYDKATKKNKNVVGLVTKEENEIEEGMSMKDFKANRKKNERKEASVDARKRGHEGSEWHNTGRTYSADEAKSRRAKMTDTERSARHASAVDPDNEDHSNYSADKTKDPKKLRKQKAMGEGYLAEKSLSRAQQRFMGMVYAAKKGETPASPEVAKAAEKMSKKSARDFAKTKHAGLPEKKEEVKEELSLVDKILDEAIQGTIAGGKSKAKKYKAVAKQAKLAAAVNKAMKDDSEPAPQKSEEERKTEAKKQVKRGKSDPSALTRRAAVAGAARLKAEKEKTKRQRERQQYEKERRAEKKAERQEKAKEKQEKLESSYKEKRIKAAQQQSDKEEGRKEKTKSEVKGAVVGALKTIKAPQAVSDKAKGSTGATVDSYLDSAGSVVSAVGKGVRGVIAAKMKERKEKKQEQKRQERHEKIRSEMSKEEFSNWREEFILEVDDQSVQNEKQKVIDISKKKNKIEINPNMSEECGCDEKEKETPKKDMRDLPTKVNLAKTKLRSAGVRNPVVMVTSEENIQEIAPLVGVLARVAGGAAARGITSRVAGSAAQGTLRSKAAELLGKKAGEMTAQSVQDKLTPKFKDEPETDSEPYMTNLEKKLRNEDWQSVNRKDKTDGLSQKAVNAYRRENPGSKLQTAVTEKNPEGKRAARRKSFCSRMSGMKKRLTSAETARDPDSRINKALRRWNCN